MNDKDRQAAADAILSIPFFHVLMDEIEKSAINRCIFADLNDDETRRNAAAEARAVKTFRQRIEALSLQGQSTVSRKAPA